jgi:4-amino-4-deoxy-L-arabinose transferase-like glycosyltransferase
MRARHWPLLFTLVLVGGFLLVSLPHLDSVPQVYEDEPWQASVGYKLATQGVFGSDLFAGFYNMDQRYYGFMPLHPLLLAGFFKALGTGLAQARLETVLLTVLTLLLTYALGARLFSPAVGALGVAILVLVRWTGLTYVQVTGIPMVDFARIARYDPLVPVVGLAALHVYLSARSRQSSLLYAAAGVLAGLAGLAHVYGLFWVPTLIALSVADRRWRHALVPLAAGAMLPWLPYAAYVLSDLPDWRGQTAIYASRFELLNPRWYLSNLVQEYHRYGPGLGPPGLEWLARPGGWFLLISLPLSLLALARRALACDAAARAIVIPALLMPLLFALLITLKLVNYTLIELPLFALAIAWGMYTVWCSRPRIRPALLALAAAVTVEGGLALTQLERAAATATPYPTFVSEIRQSLPSGARVLGLHSYWLGLQDFDYRSFLVPLNWADLGEPLDQALDDVHPDVVLLDVRMRTYFQSLPPGGDGDRFSAWLSRHSAQRIASIDDPTYGLLEVYRVNR